MIKTTNAAALIRGGVFHSTKAKGEVMPKILISKNTVCGKKHVKRGEAVEASDSDAALLIGMGKAVEADSDAVKELDKEIKAEKSKSAGS